MDKGDITLDDDKIRHLQKSITEKFKDLNPDQEINWNSATENYKTLRDSILSLLGNNIDIGLSFLRGFFYHANKLEKNKFRLKNINVLSQYAFNENYLQYISKKGKDVNRQDFVYFVSNGESEDRMKMHKELKDYENKIELGGVNPEEIFTQVENVSQVVHIYVSDAMLKNEKGARVLMYVFSDNLMRMLINYDVRFYFDDVVKGGEKSDYDIVTNTGRIKYFKYWQNKQDDIKELIEGLPDEVKAETEDYSDLVSTAYFTTLKALSEIYARLERIKREDIIKYPKIDNFQPFIKSLLDLEVVTLDKSYKYAFEDNRGNPKKIEPCSFFCVICYEDYFDTEQKEEMIEHFCNYNFQLRRAGHEVVRIFTIPAKRVKNKGWNSTLNTEGNKILYQYIYTNLITECDTYILMYNEEYSKNGEVLVYQDYVVRLSRNGKSWEDILESDNIFKYETQAELYMSYPEDKYGRNQLLVIPQEKDKDSIFLYFKDFQERMGCRGKQGDGIMIESISEEHKKSLIKKLNLNLLPSNTIKKLEREVDIYLDDVKKNI